MKVEFLNQWYGAFVPSHTPRDVIKVLNNALVEAVRTPAIAPQWANQILMPVGDTPEEFAGYYNEEIVKWAQVLKPVSTPQ
jgi:tripartite-type tricarboxylate transporter receptor subunit TctC